MASKSAIAEKLGRALSRIKASVPAICEGLGIETGDALGYVKGSPDYQEAVRTEQLATLLEQIQAKTEKKVAPAETESGPVVPPVEQAPVEGEEVPAPKKHGRGKHAKA